MKIRNLLKKWSTKTCHLGTELALHLGAQTLAAADQYGKTQTRMTFGCDFLDGQPKKI